MADDADRASDYVDLTLAHCLSRAPKFDKPSLTECLECGKDIPARRQAVGGVTLCVDCKPYLRKGAVMLTNNEQLLVITGMAILLGMLVVAVIWLLSIELNKGE